MINKLSQKVKPKSKGKLDPPPVGKPYMDPDNEIGYTETDESIPKFAQRYLNNVVNTN